MIIEITLENGFVSRKSDRGVYIKNVQTGKECVASYELSNDVRINQGLEPYSFVETERIVSIDENILENGLIERKSVNGFYIKNVQLGHEYPSAVDIPNEKREKMGLEPYTYIETEKVVDKYLAGSTED